MRFANRFVSVMVSVMLLAASAAAAPLPVIRLSAGSGILDVEVAGQ